MEKKLRRLLVLLVTVMLLVSALATSAFATQADMLDCYKHGDVNGDGTVDSQDAIYVLFASMPMFKDRYPLHQNGDFNTDTKVDGQDAIYVLYASMPMFAQNYPLKGMIHSYYSPAWEWGAEEVSVTFKCGCAEEHTYTTANAEDGIVVEETERKEATCVEAGYVVKEASITVDGVEYTGSKTVVLPAGEGHDMVGTQSCTSGSKCSRCDYELPALDHVWNLNTQQSTPATCSSQAVNFYNCQNCTETKTVTVEGKLAHTYEYIGDVAGDEACEFIKQYQCTSCGTVINGTADSDSYFKHNYTVALTKDATCVAEGTKTYTCSVCGDAYDEAIAANGSHDWVEGATTNGITSHSCSACGATKTTVAVTENQGVDKAVLETVKELALEEGTTIEMDDQTKGGLADGEIKISVKPADLAETALSEEEKQQVGDNTVYDFRMTANGVPVSNFEGTVTISLPYTLSEGEDIDSIDIWFIADNGSLERMNGTYSNGFVTFETTHFSYYTVTRLTPAERCSRYGHIRVDSNKAATCTEDGYSMSVCQRCGVELAKQIFTMSGHDYQDTANAKAATCTDAGYMEQKCTNCGDVIKGEIPATGHSLSLTKIENATCEAPGKKISTCGNAGCTYASEEVLPQLQHEFAVSKVQEADCTTNGYTERTCNICGTVEISDETLPLGHKYLVDSAVWTWSDDYSEATVALTCEHDASHTKSLKGVITEKTAAASCVAAGSVTYTATASINNVTYTDTKAETTGAAGHKPKTEWSSNKTNHYHECSVCGAQVEAQAHAWGQETVIKAPTCVATGTAKVTCTVCDYVSEKTLAATGEHTYVNGICSVCGYEEGSCDHIRTYKTFLDAEAYGLCKGSEIWTYACSCGQKSSVGYNLNCHFGSDGYEMITLPDGTKVQAWTATCTNCGLKIVNADTPRVNEEDCTFEMGWYCQLSMDDTVIAEGTGFYFDGEHWIDHSEPYKVLNLADYGLCESAINYFRCACGKYQETTMSEDKPGCDFQGDVEYDEATGTETFTGVCSVCGGSCREIVRRERDLSTCTDYRTFERAYFNAAGEEVYSDTVMTQMGQMHDFETVSYELDGDSCEDGVLYKQVCKMCGKTETRYEFEHVLVLKTVTDLSNEEICADRLVQGSCACDEQYKSFHLESDDGETCMFAVGRSGEVLEVAECWKCGATQTITETIGNLDENCIAQVKRTYTYKDKNGKVLGTGEDTWDDMFHDMVTTGELVDPDGDCTGGVKVISTCKNCDFTHSRVENEGHIGFEKESFDLTSLGICQEAACIYECACGKETWFSTWTDGDSRRCDWNWVDGKENGYTEQCLRCDATMDVEFENIEKTDPCHTKRHYTYTFTSANGEELVIEGDFVDTTHGGQRFETELLDGAQSCNDGYRTIMHCDICGAVEDWGIEYGHNTRPVSQALLSEGELCGTVYYGHFRCACGQEEWEGLNWENGHCEFQWNGFDDKTGEEVSTCINCGAVRRCTRHEEAVEGEPCKTTDVWDNRILNAAGEELFSYVETNTYTNHMYEYTFQLQGTTCQDGYTRTGVCAVCGDVREVMNTQYDCSTYLVNYDKIYTSDCGDILSLEYACACGSNRRFEYRDDCDWRRMGWNADETAEMSKCDRCGLIRENRYEEIRIPNSCQVEVTRDYTYFLNDEQVGHLYQNYITESHRNEISFQMQGDTCEDGYYVTETCKYCGYVWSGEDIRFGHGIYDLKIFDLADYGMCGGTVTFEGCACGKESHMSWSNNSCNWRHVGTDPDTGLDLRKCDNCGITFVRAEVGDIDPQTCEYNGTGYLKIYDVNGNLVLNESHQLKHESHELLVDSFSLNNPDGTCNDGWFAELTCRNCGMTQSHDGYGHTTYMVKRLDLSEFGACGGYMEHWRCACGKENHLSYDFACEFEHIEDRYEKDENGIERGYYTYKCRDCGLVREVEAYEVFEPGNCQGMRYENMTLTLGANLKETFVDFWETNRHEFEFSFSLLPGSSSCEDGVQRNQTCKNCGYTTYDTCDYHGMNLVSTIDLADYGAICGSALNCYQCPCGAAGRYDFAEDSNCDVYQHDTSHWIPDILNTYQYTSEGYRNTYSHAYLNYCAVTDPDACGLKIRMAEYWLKEGCEAVEYQTWQLGYDEQTDTCQLELTVPTGEHHAFHGYVRTELNGTLDADGNELWGYRDECPDCGSYYEEASVHQNGERIRYYETAVNTLNNGENQRYDSVTEYGYVYNGYKYETVSRYEQVEANGEVYWYQNEYTYDFSQGCNRTRVYTNCYGDSDVYEDDCHLGTWDSEWLKQQTCTQFGLYREYEHCAVCGELFNEYIEEPQPYAHNWDWYYDENGEMMYYCTICGLENRNGASGTIVMEDFTGLYGMGNSYVIGYWNRDDLQFIPNVSVVLEDSTAEDNMLYLNFNDFWYWDAETDAVTAVGCDKAAVDAAAEAALIDANYTGSYAIRISFVPINGDDTLDYAITFDSQYFDNTVAA